MKKLLLPTLALVGGLLAMPAQAQSLQCREFNTTVTIGGIRQPAWGTSCLQPDGSWQIVSQQAASQPEDMEPMAYIEPEPVYIVKERPVFYRPAFSPYPYPQSSLSFGYASGDGWGHRRHHWGSGVGVGFGRHW